MKRLLTAIAAFFLLSPITAITSYAAYVIYPATASRHNMPKKM